MVGTHVFIDRTEREGLHWISSFSFEIDSYSRSCGQVIHSHNNLTHFLETALKIMGYMCALTFSFKQPLPYRVQQ